MSVWLRKSKDKSGKQRYHWHQVARVPGTGSDSTRHFQYPEFIAKIALQRKRTSERVVLNGSLHKREKRQSMDWCCERQWILKPHSLRLTRIRRPKTG